MKIVDISNFLWLQNNSPQDTSIASIAYWVRSNVPRLNSLLYEDFWIDPTGLEIMDESRETPHHINLRAVAILEVMFRDYLIGLDVRKTLFAVTSDTVLKFQDQEFEIEKVNKSEILKTLTAFKKDALKELFDLVHTYRSYKGEPRQVSGDDFMPGHFNGIMEHGYIRELY